MLTDPTSQATTLAVSALAAGIMGPQWAALAAIAVAAACGSLWSVISSSTATAKTAAIMLLRIVTAAMCLSWVIAQVLEHVARKFGIDLHADTLAIPVAWFIGAVGDQRGTEILVSCVEALKRKLGSGGAQ